MNQSISKTTKQKKENNPNRKAMNANQQRKSLSICVDHCPYKYNLEYVRYDTKLIRLEIGNKQ